MTETIKGDSVQVSPVLTHQVDIAVTAQLLNQILDKAHPLLAEGLYLAAVSPRYTLALFKALRARDDGRDERLVNRLAKFSFIQQLKDGTDQDGPLYVLQATERDILLRRWIASDPKDFVAAHRRALTFWEAHPHPDPFVQDQTRLYHLLVADGKAGIKHLTETFRTYVNKRWLAAADRLLVTAAEIRPYLAALVVPWLTDLNALLAELNDWLDYLTARLAQFRGDWDSSLLTLKKLRRRTDLPPELEPYVARAYGHARAKSGLYVEAIDQYEIALAAFARRQNNENEAEQAFTMLNLGDAHVALAISARGYREIISPKARHWQRWMTGLFSLRAMLPLIAYLSLQFGLRVWSPKFWPMLQEQDWIIARLFVTGARWYRRARQILSVQDSHADRVQADEKLAHLYLTMGDAAQAAASFRSLLQEQKAPLGEYRQASVQAGLGQALLRLKQPESALEQLQEAWPVIQAYEDIELAAQVQGLLAEAQFELGRPTETLNQFRQALRLYQHARDTVGATEIAERLQELGRDQRLSAEERRTASTTTQSITRRQYLKRFQHPAIVTFRRAGLVLLALFAFLIPMLAVHVTGGIVTTDIHFYPSPLLAPDPNYTPTLNQAVVPGVPSFEADFVLWQVLGLFLLYLLAYTLLGVFVIARTPLSTVQAAQSEAVHLDLQGLSTGHGGRGQTVRWREINRVVTADVALFQEPMPENSTTVVASPPGEIVIQGNTAWYTALQDHIRFFSPRETRVIDLGYRVLKSPAGGLYALSFLSLILFILSSKWFPSLVTANLLGTPYSLADVYPYLYLGVFLPPFWWIVIRPLYIQAHIHPHTLLPWWVASGGVSLAILRWATDNRTWLSQPDIYPYLAPAILLGSASMVIWTARLPGAHQAARGSHLHPLWVRGLLLAATVALFVVMGHGLWREVSAYHSLIVGNSQRDQGIQVQAEGQDAVAAWLLKKAEASYSHALHLLPENETAINSRAAVRALLGQHEKAIADYSHVLQNTKTAETVHAYRAMAYKSWGLDLLADGKTREAQQKFDTALDDFDRAIQLDPTNADYYAWRGVTHHTLKQLDAAIKDFERALALAPHNTQALTGQGWVLFQKAEGLEEMEAKEILRRALEKFQQAAHNDPESPEIWVAVGYAHFKLKEYPATMTAWEQAIQLAPDDPMSIISHGMGHWLLADPGRCRSDDASLEEKKETIAHLNLAIEDLNRALVLQPDDDWTYRTRAQIEYLLAFCPGYDPAEQLKTAIASYDQALKYAPQKALYWQFRARLGQALGKQIFSKGPEYKAEARATLDIAASDIRRALELDPENDVTLAWRDYITQEAWGIYYQDRGWTHYEMGNYRLAERDSTKAAHFLPESVTAAFNTGLVTLAQGKGHQAIDWYNTGLKRATAITETQAYSKTLQGGINDLTELLEANPRLRWLGNPILGNLYLRRGEVYEAASHYSLADAEFEKAATLSQDAAIAFKAGLSALAQGKSKQATDWYDEGLMRAMAIGQTQASSQAVQTALDDLTALLEANPGLRWLGVSILEDLQSAALTSE